MATPLITAKNTIVTVVEALTPPDYTANTYRHLGSERYAPDGSSGHRRFWFELNDGGEATHFTSNGADYRHNITLVMHFSTAAYGIDGAFDALANEAVLITRAINKRSASWGANVSFVRCDRYSVEPVESDDLELRIPIRVEVYETD